MATDTSSRRGFEHSSVSSCGIFCRRGLTRQQSPTRRRFERSLARVQPLLARYGYGAAFGAVMVEGMGIPAPGQTLLMAGALEAAAGRMNIVLLLFLVSAGGRARKQPGLRDRPVGRPGGAEQAQGQPAAPAASRRSFPTARRRGHFARPISRWLEAVEWDRRRGAADALVDLHGVQRRRRDSLDLRLGARNLFLGPGYPFHRGIFSPPRALALRAERDRLRGFFGVPASLSKSDQRKVSNDQLIAVGRRRTQ